MTVFEQLYRLQVIDRRLKDVEMALADQTQLKQLVEMKQREQQQGVQLTRLEEQIQTFRQQIEHSEAVMHGYQAKITEYEKRLYDGSSRAAKELEHMETQVETVRQSKIEIEQQILNIMEAVEEIDEEIHHLRDEYTAMVTSCREVERDLKEVRQKLHVEQKQLQAARKRVILTLPEAQYQHYAKLAAAHDGIAVARVKQQRCGACQVTISPAVMNRLRFATEIEHCEFCGRILFYQPPDETKKKGLH